MALEACPECNLDVNVDADTCPFCGHDLQADEHTERKNTNSLVGVFSALVLIAVAAGYWVWPSENDMTDPRPSVVSQAETEPVAQKDFGADWPFTVDSGEVLCIMDGNVEVPLFRAKDSIYALTGHGYGKLDYHVPGTIWRGNPTVESIWADLSPITDAAMELCP